MRKRASGELPGSAINRRQLLGSSLQVAGTVALIPLVETACTAPAINQVSVLGATNDNILAAFVDRLLPADELGPAASASGVVVYINRALAEWNQSEIATLSTALQALDGVAQKRHGNQFPALIPAEQDALLTALEAGELSEVAQGQGFFNRLHRLTLEGMFSDPYYGGNANYAGWDLIGYPGAVLASTSEMQKMGERLPPLHTSAYGAEHDGH